MADTSTRDLLKEQLEKHEVVTYIKRSKLLMGLFIPPPRYPPIELTTERLLQRGLPRVALLLVASSLFMAGTLLLLLWLRVWTILCILLPPVVYGGYRKVKSLKEQPAGLGSGKDLDWKTQCAEYFDGSDGLGQQRREETAADIIASVKPQEAEKFNAYVQSATSIAIYGCGILAATHVGGLRALERHGMEYKNLHTLAGVSAGSVVAAMVAVGYNADELFALIQRLPFNRLAAPELGAVSRMLGNLLQDALYHLGGKHLSDVAECLAGGSGPGLNSGSALEEMIGNALKEKCGNADITFGDVKKRFGKRLVILVCELDSGKERRLTPETDPNLPVRAAVRMSMGVPGIMEPFAYQDETGEEHIYCDGGMCNDFPLNALPEDDVRIGLMIRPVDWITHHSGGAKDVVSDGDLEKVPKVVEHFQRLRAKTPVLFRIKSLFDLIMTCVNTMMDANLILQIQSATAKKGILDSKTGISKLAPEVLTLCGGRLDPFDFNLSKEQHKELFLGGQLVTHMHASMVDGEHKVMSVDSKLKTLLYCMHLDYPKTA